MVEKASKIKQDTALSMAGKRRTGREGDLVKCPDPDLMFSEGVFVGCQGKENMPACRECLIKLYGIKVEDSTEATMPSGRQVVAILNGQENLKKFITSLKKR